MPGPSFDLSDKTALVTGGGSGLGLAMAEGLAAAGAKVVVVGRDRKKLEAGAKAIGAAGAEVCDLLDRAAIAPLVDARRARARAGRDPGQQRRHPAPRAGPGFPGRGLGPHDRDASLGAVLPRPGGRARHDRAAPRQDHQHALGHLRARAADDHPLRLGEGRLAHADAGARGRARAAQHPGQRHWAGLFHDRDEPGADRQPGVRRLGRRSARPPAAGAIPRSSPAPRCSSPRPRPITSPAR